MKEKLSLNGLGLKLLGWLFTLCAAAGQLWGGSVLPSVGLIALPIFAFLLVEGFEYAQSCPRYLLRILAVAVITEPFYDFACTGAWLDLVSSNGQNILFALALGLVELIFLHAVGFGTPLRILGSILGVLCAGLWSFLLNIPGGILVTLLVGAFYLLEDHPRAKFISAGAAGLLLGITPVLALPLISFYNGERGNYPKLIFYAAYPLLWAVIACGKLFRA